MEGRLPWSRSRDRAGTGEAASAGGDHQPAPAREHDLTAADLDLFADRGPPAEPEQPGPLERRLREEALERLEAQRHEWVERIRAAMRLLFYERRQACLAGGWDSPVGRETTAWVSADDARRWFEDHDPPADLNRNFLGAVFRARGWRPMVGRRILSQTPGSHANELKLWTFYPTSRSSE